MTQSHSQRRPHPEEGSQDINLYRDDGHDDVDDDDHSRSAIPREISFVRRRIADAGSTSTSRPAWNKSPSSGSGTACTCTGSSRSSNSTGARLRSFFVRKSSKLLGGGRRLSNKISKRPKEAHLHVPVADEGPTHDVDMGGNDTGGRSTACDENEVRGVAQGAPADTAQMPPPADGRSNACDENDVCAEAQGAPTDTAQIPPAPPSYEEALRLGLFKRPTQQESLQQNDFA